MKLWLQKKIKNDPAKVLEMEINFISVGTYLEIATNIITSKILTKIAARYLLLLFIIIIYHAITSNLKDVQFSLKKRVK